MLGRIDHLLTTKYCGLSGDFLSGFPPLLPEFGIAPASKDQRFSLRPRTGTPWKRRRRGRFNRENDLAVVADALDGPISLRRLVSVLGTRATGVGSIPLLSPTDGAPPWRRSPKGNPAFARKRTLLEVVASNYAAA